MSIWLFPSYLVFIYFVIHPCVLAFWVITLVWAYCNAPAFLQLVCPLQILMMMTTTTMIYIVSQKVPPLACYNFDAHEWILIFFGRNVTDKVGNQNTLYYATSNNLCFCTTWQNAETWKSHISLNWIVLHTQCTCALFSWKKKLFSVMCLIASNICWDSKISH